MRSNGVEEKYITGDASDREKFQKWAETEIVDVAKANGYRGVIYMCEQGVKGSQMMAYSFRCFGRV